MPAPAGSQVAFSIHGPIVRADLPGLCERVGGQLAASRATVAVCDVGCVAQVDAVTVDALARLAVVARRHGAALHLVNVPAPLRELIDLVGLGEVLAPGSGGQPPRQPEQTEQPLGVEEEGQLSDPAA